MILVITGTERFSFHRLVAAVDELASEQRLSDDVFVQLGCGTYVPNACEWQRLIPFREMAERIEQASLVISHAGAGTILLCLQYGQRPVVVPRRKKYAEHVDDHQLMFARKLDEQGLVYCVEETGELHTRIREAEERVAAGRDDSGARELVDFLEQQVSKWS